MIRKIWQKSNYISTNTLFRNHLRLFILSYKQLHGEINYKAGTKGKSKDAMMNKNVIFETPGVQAQSVLLEDLLLFPSTHTRQLTTACCLLGLQRYLHSNAHGHIQILKNTTKLERKLPRVSPAMVVHDFNPSTWEAESGVSLWI